MLILIYSRKVQNFIEFTSLALSRKSIFIPQLLQNQFIYFFSSPTERRKTNLFQYSQSSVKLDFKIPFSVEYFIKLISFLKVNIIS